MSCPGQTGYMEMVIIQLISYQSILKKETGGLLFALRSMTGMV